MELAWTQVDLKKRMHCQAGAKVDLSILPTPNRQRRRRDQIMNGKRSGEINRSNRLQVRWRYQPKIELNGEEWSAALDGRVVA